MATIDTSDHPRLYCNTCGNPTVHKACGECKATSKVFDEPSRVTVHFTDTYTLLQCAVCGQGQLRLVEWNSENEAGEPRFFPPPHVRRPPDWIRGLQPPYGNLLEEVYAALDSGLYGIALMGVRAILDVWVSSQTATKNNFSKKLANLASIGTLSGRQVEVLESVFDAGSAAAHRGYRPALQDAISATEAVEHLLHQEVLLPRIAALKSKTPPRDTR